MSSANHFSGKEWEFEGSVCGLVIGKQRGTCELLKLYGKEVLCISRIHNTKWEDRSL